MTATTAPVERERRERLLQPGCGPLTVDDWYSLPETPDQYELDRGVLIVVPPPGFGHQVIVSAIHASLWEEGKASGGLSTPAPTGVELARDIGYEPDVLYLTKERLERIVKRGVRGAPNIVVEVLSPSTRRRDLLEKLPVYLESGVEEAWMVDPEARTVAVHRPGEEPQVVSFGASIPSRIVSVGAAGLDRLPELPED